MPVARSKKVLVIDPNDLREGTCRIMTSASDPEEKFAVVLEDGKLKIYPIEG